MISPRHRSALSLCLGLALGLVSPVRSHATIVAFSQFVHAEGGSDNPTRVYGNAVTTCLLYTSDAADE